MPYLNSARGDASHLRVTEPRWCWETTVGAPESNRLHLLRLDDYSTSTAGAYRIRAKDDLQMLLGHTAVLRIDRTLDVVKTIGADFECKPAGTAGLDAKIPCLVSSGVSEQAPSLIYKPNARPRNRNTYCRSFQNTLGHSGPDLERCGWANSCLQSRAAKHRTQNEQSHQLAGTLTANLLSASPRDRSRLLPRALSVPSFPGPIAASELERG
jgi:hypothetical protein